MRARNIKPGLFTNEVLGQADPAFTVLFVGLWCVADREGRLEDRPVRLRAALLPYRPEFDMEAALSWLQHVGFIDRYNVDGVAIIQVIKFAEHQRPHHNEVPSVLPSKVVASAVHPGRKRAPPKNGQGEKGFALIPDSLLSDPPSPDADPGLRIPDPPLTALPPKADVDASKYWEAICKAYPKGTGGQRWATGKKLAVKLVTEGRATWNLLYRNVCAYAELCHLQTRKPLDVRNYFSESDEPWSNSWEVEQIRAPLLEQREREREERAAQDAANAKH